MTPRDSNTALIASVWLEVLMQVVGDVWSGCEAVPLTSMETCVNGGERCIDAFASHALGLSGVGHHEARH